MIARRRLPRGRLHGAALLVDRIIFVLAGFCIGCGYMALIGGWFW